MGAIVGGLAQNLSFILGLKALLLLAAAFYMLAAISAALPDLEIDHVTSVCQ